VTKLKKNNDAALGKVKVKVKVEAQITLKYLELPRHCKKEFNHV